MYTRKKKKKKILDVARTPTGVSCIEGLDIKISVSAGFIGFFL
jgi:hypothetical protein